MELVLCKTSDHILYLYYDKFRGNILKGSDVLRGDDFHTNLQRGIIL